MALKIKKIIEIRGIIIFGWKFSSSCLEFKRIDKMLVFIRILFRSLEQETKCVF
jgi:hypothetical protein